MVGQRDLYAEQAEEVTAIEVWRALLRDWWEKGE
jgi:hypothetical protein